MSSASKPTSFPTLYPEVSSLDLGFSVALYSVGFAILVIVYSIARQLYKNIYFPRYFNATEDQRLKSKPPSKRFFLWFLPLLRGSCDEEVLHKVGLDAFIVLRILRLGFVFFAALTPVLFLIFVPIYASFSNGSTSTSGVHIISLSNVPSENAWVFSLCCIMVYVVSAGYLWLIRREYLYYLKLRHGFYMENSPNAHTVLVERIPKALASKTALKRYFEALVGDVESVELVPSDSVLQELRQRIAERDDVLEKLERSQYEDASCKSIQKHIVFLKDESTKEEKRICGCISLSSRAFCYGSCCFYCCNGRYVESTNYYSSRLENLNEIIPKLQNHVEESTSSTEKEYRSGSAGSTGYKVSNDSEFIVARSMSNLYKTESEILEEAAWLLDEGNKGEGSRFAKSAAFVTFKTKLATTVSSRIPLNELEASLFVNIAKEPRDIIWEHIGYDKGIKLLISLAIIILYILLVTTFGLLTTLISATTQLGNIRQGWQALDDFLNDNPWLVPLLDQIAPLLLVIVFALVPPILNLIIQLHKPSAFSTQDLWFYFYYYMFQVIQVFLFYQISGSIYQLVFLAYQNPWEAIRILAAQIPANATFYMQYILLRALVIFPIELLRVGDYAVALLVRPIFCGISRTNRERQNDICGCNTLDHPPDPWHSRNLTQIMLIFTMGIVFSLMAPLVVPIVAFYAIIALITLRNQVLYVYIQVYESGGRLWSSVARSFVFSIILFQLTMMGIFVLNNQPVATGFMLPAIVFTGLAARYMDITYHTTMREIPLATAKTFDITKALEARRQRTSSYDDTKASFKHPLLLRKSREYLDPQRETGMTEQGENDVEIESETSYAVVEG